MATKKRFFLITLIGAIVLCLIGVFIILKVTHVFEQTKSNTATKPGKEKVIVDDTSANTQTIQAATSVAMAGDPTKAQAQLDEAINGTTVSADKASLFLAKSTVAINAGDQASALTFAKQAETLNPGLATYDTLGYLYAKAGDTQQAISYYKKALQIVSKKDVKETPPTGASPDYYVARIIELGGTLDE